MNHFNPKREIKSRTHTLMKVCGYTSEEYARWKARLHVRIIQEAQNGSVPIYVRANKKLNTREIFIMATLSPRESRHNRDPRNKYIKFIDLLTGERHRVFIGQSIEVRSRGEYERYIQEKEIKNRTKRQPKKGNIS